jgi:hypothetical protein
MIQDQTYLPTLVIRNGRFTSYLADMFKEINELNQSLQQKITDISILNSKTSGLSTQASVSWSKGFNMFTNLNYFIHTNEISLCNLIKKVIFGHTYMFLPKIFSKLN